MPGIRRLLIIAVAILSVIATGQQGGMTAYAQSQNREPITVPDLTALVAASKQENADVVGWLQIPGTEIDRVILQNPPNLADNTYYLNRDFQKSPHRDGCFCTDFRVKTGDGSRAALSRNTTIYGHSWTDDPDGALFAQLKRYRDPDFARAHPYIFYSTHRETMVWEVVAVFEATTAFPYITPDPSDKRLRSNLARIEELSLYDYANPPTMADKFLTLSTCVYSVLGQPELPALNDYRFVVMARLVAPDEPLKSQADFVINAERIPPMQKELMKNE
jgi:sortase B